MKKDAIPDSWYWRGVKRHLVNQFKDGDEDVVVYKEWNSRKQRWNYNAEQRGDVVYEIMLARRVEDEQK